MNGLRVVAIIQARMGSSRLFGKVMKPIAGRPMIHHVVQRTGRIEGVDEVVVATSSRAVERPLVEYVSSMDKARLFRGSEPDVLQRYYHAARSCEADVVMRITADCPLLSPRESSKVLKKYLRHRRWCDYVTNTLERTYPRGLDTSVMSFEVLQRSHTEADHPAHREHVTLYISSNRDRFRLLGVCGDDDYSHLRWTVDTEPDLRLVRRIYDALYWRKKAFEYEHVLELLAEYPEWAQINAGVRQKEV